MNKYLTQAINLAKEYEKLQQVLDIISIRTDYNNGKNITAIHLPQYAFEKCFDKWEVEDGTRKSEFYQRIIDGVKVFCVVDKEEEK